MRLALNKGFFGSLTLVWAFIPLRWDDCVCVLVSVSVCVSVCECKTTTAFYTLSAGG